MKLQFSFIGLLLLFSGCDNPAVMSTPERQTFICGNTPPNIEGRRLFATYCASCHNMLKDATGPALTGTLARWGGDTALLKKYLRNPGAAIRKAGKHSRIAKLHARFGNVRKPTYGGLAQAEFEALVLYICQQPGSY